MAREERLSVNLFDLEKLGPELVARILGGKISRELIVIDPSKEDEIAVELICGLESAALAIDIIRSENRRDKVAPIRAYIFRQTWSKIPITGVLTVEHRGTIVLNPIFFPKIVSMEEAVPLAPKKMEW